MVQVPCTQVPVDGKAQVLYKLVLGTHMPVRGDTLHNWCRG